MHRMFSCDILLHTVKVQMYSIASHFYSTTYITQLMRNVQIWSKCHNHTQCCSKLIRHCEEYSPLLGVGSVATPTPFSQPQSMRLQLISQTEVAITY